MTKCLNCIHYTKYLKCRCKINEATINLKWEQMSVQDDCEYFEPTRNIVETSEYRASHYQPPKECNINQTRFGSD